MSVVKEYFKQEAQWRMLKLEHPKTADFYLSSWQTNRSTTPLLVLRTLLFLASVTILLSSVITYILNELFNYWFIFLTHWGLLLITVTTGFATFISARSRIFGPICAEFSLPWYVKTYWFLYNTSIPIAFLITTFYWTVLYEAGIEEEINHELDVAVHGLNTVVMFILLFTSSLPSRLLHVYQPIVFALFYVCFGVIYYLAGGKNTEGDPWIYPVIYWAKPLKTLGWVTLTGVLLLFLHLITMGLAAIRNTISAKYIKPTVIGHVQEGVPLRQTTA